MYFYNDDDDDDDDDDNNNNFRIVLALKNTVIKGDLRFS
jgi:hypothetical protein